MLKQQQLNSIVGIIVTELSAQKNNFLVIGFAPTVPYDYFCRVSAVSISMLRPITDKLGARQVDFTEF